MFGFININKPKGITSHDVVSRLRQITKIRQIGHTGTLDPFAEGVLPVCIGKATRLIEFLKDDKAYIATLQLGSATDTYDIEGSIVKETSKKVNIAAIESVLPDFRGEIEQFPPIYSAIKIKGKKLYEYARNNEKVEISSRKVLIDKLNIMDFDCKKNTLQLYIECSKGTYIRSLANDIGIKLGCFAHLIKLVRVKAGNFKYEDSIKLDDLTDIYSVEKNIIQPLKYLDYPRYELSEKEKIIVSNGNSININNNFSNDIVLLIYQNKIIAVAKCSFSQAKCLKVFS